MTVTEYIKEQTKAFLSTRNDDYLEEQKKLLNMVIDNNISSNYFNNEINKVQDKWEQDWFEWITMNHNFDTFSKKEQEEIKKTKSPINFFNVED
jgi:hypothetical protein